MSPFEERLLETLFTDFIPWSNECIATYMIHIPDQKMPIFFKKMSDDILEHAINHLEDVTVFAIKTDGSVDDVTRAWQRVFDKQRSTKKLVDDLVKQWIPKVPETVATFEVKSDGVTLGYFPYPTQEILKSVGGLRSLRTLTILAIHKTGTIEDVTAIWKPLFTEYVGIFHKLASN